MPNKYKILNRENFISIVITALFIFGFLIICNSSNQITSFVVQDRFLIQNISIVAKEISKPIKIEQFDDYEIKIDNALYYFTAENKRNYILIDFIVDSSQIKEFEKDDISLHQYKDNIWEKLETKFTEQDGRFYYYRTKTNELGLFAVVPTKKIEKVSQLSRDNLILFGILPIIIILLLFSIITYESVKYLKKTEYKIYLIFKKILTFLMKFTLILLVNLLIIDLIASIFIRSTNIIATKLNTLDIINYAILPLLIISLTLTILLNKLVKYLE